MNTSSGGTERFDDLPILAELRDRLTVYYRSANQDPHAARVVRTRRGRPLVLLAVLVLAGATAALAATGVFRAGSPVASDVPPTPGAKAGVAVAGSVRVLPLRFADPAGGPPWGLRIERTTRGLICVQPGRVEFGQVGALGIDGALGNDGRFHPFSTKYLDQYGCAVADGDGHAFTVATLHDAPTSAILASCPPSATVGADPPCPPGALRDISYGMFGPDAVSITYADPTGRLITIPTAGPDGAFLVISVPRPHCARCGGSYATNSLDAGVIRKVTYLTGRTCVLPSPAKHTGARITCPSFGYVAAAAKHVTSAQVASTVTVSHTGLQYFCRASRFGGAKPCGSNPPPNAHREPYPPEYVATVAFTARVAVENVDSHYTIAIHNPRLHTPTCEEGASSVGNTNLDLHAGQHVQTRFFIPRGCYGTFHVSVTYSAPGSPAVPVGHATMTVAHAKTS